MLLLKLSHIFDARYWGLLTSRFGLHLAEMLSLIFAILERSHYLLMLLLCGRFPKGLVEHLSVFIALSSSNGMVRLHEVCLTLLIIILIIINVIIIIILTGLLYKLLLV